MGETLGESGLQLDSAEPDTVAAALRALLSREELRKDVLEKQRARLADFTHERVLQQAEALFGEVLRG